MSLLDSAVSRRSDHPVGPFGNEDWLWSLPRIMTGHDDDTADVTDRLAELEAEVASLRETVEQQYEVIAVLAAAVDSEALPEMACPYCDDGSLTTQSGITWERTQCTDCEFSQYL